MFVAFLFFFFNDTATTEIYTLSLHDALPISVEFLLGSIFQHFPPHKGRIAAVIRPLWGGKRSEEHTSELQSRLHLVCRLLLEKKKKTHYRPAFDRGPPLIRLRERGHYDHDTR